MNTRPGTTEPRHIVLATIGTRGDIYPLLAIGRALIGRGHRVTFAGPDNFREAAVACGMTHRTLRPHPRVHGDNTQGKMGGGSAVRDRIYPAVEDTYNDLLAAAAGADLMVFPMYIFPGPMAAERLGIPWAVTHAAPASLYSAYDPPYLPPAPWMYRLQRMSPLVPRLFHPVARFAVRKWAEPLHVLRAREGFPPLKDELVLGGMRSPWMTVALFSPCFGAAQPDWPQPAVVAGFPFLDEPVHADAEMVERFLDAGDAPLVATLGSVASGKRRECLRNIVTASRAVRQRLLLIAGKDGAALREELGGAADVLVMDYVPYTPAFRGARAVIVAGSVGPVSHALRVGMPMLVIAAEEGADQPDNALRVTRLGVARWMHLRKATAESITAELRVLLGNAGYARKAHQWAAQVGPEDGIARACDALEATAARRGQAAAAAQG